MTREEIISIVETATGLTINSIAGKKTREVQHARYVAIMMMREEGYRIRYIGKGFTPEIDRSTIYKAMTAMDKMIINNKGFKKMYLACIRHMAEMEDVA